MHLFIILLFSLIGYTVSWLANTKADPYPRHFSCASYPALHFLPAGGHTGFRWWRPWIGLLARPDSICELSIRYLCTPLQSLQAAQVVASFWEAGSVMRSVVTARVFKQKRLRQRHPRMRGSQQHLWSDMMQS